MPKIGPVIGVEGEPEYRRQINEIIEVSKTLDKEMKALTATFDDETTEQEKATQSSYLLAEQLDQARKRTQLVREMTAKARDTTEENSTATLKWRQALAEAEENQAKLERAVRENNAAMQEQGRVTEADSDKMVGLGDAVNQVAGKLGITLPEGATKALNGMEGFSVGSVAAVAKVTAGVAVAVKAVKELADIAVESAEKVDALKARAAQTGLDAGLLQQLDYAQRFIDFDNIDKILVRLTQNMGKAKEGAEAQTKAFRRLGVSIYDEDGKLRDNWKTFLDVIDALGRVKNETERDTIANNLFGKSYSEMKPLVDAGTGALNDYMQKAEDLGIVLDEAEREKLQQLNDVLDDNAARWGALKDRLSLAVAPALSHIVDLSNDAVTAVSRIDFDKIGAVTEWLIENHPAVWLADVLRKWKDDGEETDSIQGEIDQITQSAAQLEAQIQETADTGQAAMEQTTEKAQEAADAQIVATIQMEDAIAALAESYEKAYAAAYQSLDGQFGLWEKVEKVSATSTDSMIEGLHSQLDYWYDYAADFEDLMSRNVEGVEDLAKNFTDGSKESAAALAGLRQASDEEIAAVIRKMDQTEEMKRSISERFAALETDLAANLQNIRDDFGGTMTELQDDANGVDFSPFEAEVDAAFGYLENRAQAAVAYVDSQISSMTGQINNVAAMTPVGFNAAGTDYWRGGLTWVGESGPELISLPRGTQIFSAAESQAMAAAGSPGAGGTLGGLSADDVRRGVIDAINELGGMPQSQGPARFYIGATEIARATYDAREEVGNEHGISMIS